MKKGDFSLEVINAETREPMKEFTAPDGKVYIEAEPDLEYFLRCKSDVGLRSPGVQTYATFDVDSTPLGYKLPFTTASPEVGLWKRISGNDTYVALKFVLKRARAIPAASNPLGSTPNALPPVGKITVVFHEMVKGQGMYEDRDEDKTSIVPSSVDGSTESFSAMAKPKGKKAFASVAGSTVSGAVDSKPRSGASAVKPRLRQKYENGRRLGEISIHYTSALGFIHLGILSIPSQQSASQSNNNRMEASAEPARSAATDTSSFPAEASLSNSNYNNQDHDDKKPEKKRIKTGKNTSADNKKHATIDLTADDSD